MDGAAAAAVAGGCWLVGGAGDAPAVMSRFEWTLRRITSGRRTLKWLSGDSTAGESLCCHTANVHVWMNNTRFCVCVCVALKAIMAPRTM